MPTYAMSLSLRNRRTDAATLVMGVAMSINRPSCNTPTALPRPTPANSSEGLRVGLPKFAEITPWSVPGFPGGGANSMSANPAATTRELRTTPYLRILPMTSFMSARGRPELNVRKYLAAKGWKTPAKVTKGSDGSFWFEVLDPEGNKVQFVQPSATVTVDAPMRSATISCMSVSW